MKHYTSNPSENGQWYVWDMHEPLPPRPVFVGSMEDAGLVADALNRRHEPERMRSLILDLAAEIRREQT